ALCLRGEAEDERPRDQPAEPDDQGDRPRPGELAGGQPVALADRQRRLVAADPLEQQLAGELDGGDEGERPQPGDDPDEGAEQEPLAEVVPVADDDEEPPDTPVARLHPTVRSPVPGPERAA